MVGNKKYICWNYYNNIFEQKWFILKSDIFPALPNMTSSSAEIFPWKKNLIDAVRETPTDIQPFINKHIELSTAVCFEANCS